MVAGWWGGGVGCFGAEEEKKKQEHKTYCNSAERALPFMIAFESV